MILFVEGIDNVGKGTQINLIRSYFKDYKFQIMHHSNVKGVDRKYSLCLYKKTFDLVRVAMANDISLILDRSHLGEYVYSEMYRGYDGNYVFDIEDQYNDVTNNAILIVLIDKPENTLKRDDGKSLSTNLENRIKEKERFEYAYEKSRIKNKILINIDCKSIEEVNKEITNYINKVIE